jgi:hypothetical protein
MEGYTDLKGIAYEILAGVGGGMMLWTVPLGTPIVAVAEPVHETVVVPIVHGSGYAQSETGV